jgi:AP-3 complex subunit delta-1
MLNHSKPVIRKRAVTAIHTLASADMARMIEERGDLTRDQYAASVDPTSSKTMDVWVERFREKLLDDDIGVVSSTVNVICELASKEPWPWLELAAELYDLLKLKKNNWMMIKIVKIVCPLLFFFYFLA